MTLSTVYLDSSVVLRWLLQQPGAIPNWGEWGRGVTSELMRIEVRRALDSMRLRRKLSLLDVAVILDLLRGVVGPLDEIRIQPSILERAASAFPAVLGALDAIHLATALLWVQEKSEALTFLTHDRQLAVVAAACGLDVGPEPILPLRER